MPAVSKKIWEELKTYGVSTVEITGSGSGDSGQVDEVIFDPEIDVPKELAATLEEITQDAWSKHFGAYYDGDGGQAEATFDVRKRKLTLRVGYYSTNLDWQDSFVVT